MKTIRLLGNNDQEHLIPLEATAISEVIQAEVECQEDIDDYSSDHENDVCCVVATLSLGGNKEITNAALSKVSDFLSHYVKDEMVPIEPPFTSNRICDIVNQEWYAEFITAGVDHTLLLEIIAAANFLSIQPLLKLAALAISIEMNGKTPNEIRPMFGISNDLNDPVEKARVKAENEWATESRRRFDERRVNRMDT
eukprot:scaffold143_cov58-Cyclotella_meneghiniana.AAC.2